MGAPHEFVVLRVPKVRVKDLRQPVRKYRRAAATPIVHADSPAVPDATTKVSAAAVLVNLPVRPTWTAPHLSAAPTFRGRVRSACRSCRTDKRSAARKKTGGRGTTGPKSVESKFDLVLELLGGAHRGHQDRCQLRACELRRRRLSRAQHLAHPGARQD